LQAIPREILICQDNAGREPFTEWLNSLDVQTRARIRVRIDRLEDGLFGDVEPVGEGVSELKLDFGRGYRVYFGQIGLQIHLLLGGSKQRQSADIRQAKSFGGNMTIKTSSYRQCLLTALLDPIEASAYLNAALEDSPEAFLKALKNVAQARTMSDVARESGIQRETLYRAFSEHGNPTFETLSSVLGTLGMKLSIAPNQSESAMNRVKAAK
jgi:putative addiction module killer protein/probable addiction module antidote protein